MSIQIILTEEDFAVDEYTSDELSTWDTKWLQKYNHNKFIFFLDLGLQSTDEVSQSLGFLRWISQSFFRIITNDPRFQLTNEPFAATASEDDIIKIVSSVPYILGYENVSETWVKNLFDKASSTYISEVKKSGIAPASYLAQKNSKLVVPSRVYFHIVESQFGSDFPFAFLATYTAVKNGKVAHLPLQNALRSLAKDNLPQLLSVVYEAAGKSELIKKFVDSGDIFAAIKITDSEAYELLKAVATFEECGIICRVPRWYTAQDAKVIVDLDEKKNYQDSYIYQSAVNAFVPTMEYHGLTVSIEEIKELLSKTEGLYQLKGKWTEVNHQQLEQLLEEFEMLSGDGTTLRDVLKSKSSHSGKVEKQLVTVEFSREDWLKSLLKKSENDMGNAVPEAFASVLRPYQKSAYHWLWGMYQYRFGVCLADDMGLGKTIEVLAFLKKLNECGGNNVLIIVPATLVNNWLHEMERFAPDLGCFILRGGNAPQDGLVREYITITTYQTAVQSEYIATVKWDVVILDEAQAIKNYQTSQARKVKLLCAEMKIAMTGTPIENNLLELWSIFDFINPGLLGNRVEFMKFYNRNRIEGVLGGSLKTLISPFVLRRLKTDSSIISDLPEKNETDIFINLSREQIALYRGLVDDMNRQIGGLKNKRDQKMVVLGTVMRLKQTCNHPAQFLGDDNYSVERSGKFIQLKNICETIYAKREKVLVFTQFKEIIPALDALLTDVFHKKGACIDGNTSMRQRDIYVSEFQNGKYPYMVLSLKTAGVGLTLTAAQHVVHFDRWWNPAVENQATDRAYRIGQKKKVTVYKFVSANTIEEVINTMLKDKQELADEYINSIDVDVSSKLSTEELMRAMRCGEFDE